jgi:hypothetical protein
VHDYLPYFKIQPISAWHFLNNIIGAYKNHVIRRRQIVHVSSRLRLSTTNYFEHDEKA